MTQLPAHLADLAPLRAAFVRCYVELAGDGLAAARAAGYSDTGRSASTRAYNLLRDPKVQRALRQEIEARFKQGAALALTVLEDLARKGPPAQRLAAAQTILQHAGYLVAKHSIVDVTVTHDGLSNQELDQKISRLLAELSPEDRQRLLPSPPAIDADFSVVEAPAEDLGPPTSPVAAPAQDEPDDDVLGFLNEIADE